MDENKYAKGKIYKITSEHTDKIYIGSTIQSLKRRLEGHERDFKSEDKHVSSQKLITLGVVKIELIEAYPCESKRELHARERHHIEANKSMCVNISIPTRTRNEYREENFVEIAKKNNEEIICEICHERYIRTTKSRHMKRPIHIQWKTYGHGF